MPLPDADYAASYITGMCDDRLVYRPGMMVEAMQRLYDYGVVFGDGYRSVSPAAAGVLVAEAVNLASKKLSKEFYDIKPAVVVDVAISGANEGVILHRMKDDRGDLVYDLYHPDVGVASFHDPYGEIDKLVRIYEPNMPVVENAFSWSGVERQSQAFALLEDEWRVEQMAYETAPKWKTQPSENFVQRVNRNHNESHAMDRQGRNNVRCSYHSSAGSPKGRC